MENRHSALTSRISAFVASPSRTSKLPTSPNRVSTLTGSFMTQRAEPFQNLTNTFQRSFISTSRGKSPRNTSVDRSKIKTLPNYERYSMGNNLPFVTVFQTIEIERLSEEVETQRVRLKEFERQIFNAENFEVQIKELTDKCAQSEDEIGEYRDELDKMNKICETLYHENETLKSKLKDTDSSFKTKLEEEIKKNSELLGEIERWKKKYHSSEKEKQREMEEMKQMMEKQRKSMLDREIKDMEVRHQNEIANITTEIRRLTQMLSIKDKDYDDLKAQNQQNKISLKQLRDYGCKLSEYEEKISLLTQEHSRLTHIIDMTTNELDEAKKKELRLAQQIQSERQLFADNQHLKQLVEAREDELEEYKQKAKQLEVEAERCRELSLFNEELERKVSSAISENQKFVKLLKERSNEIEKWKKISLELEGQSQKCRQMEDDFIEIEGKFGSLQAESERLKSSLKAKSNELEEMTLKYAVMRSQSDQAARFERERKNIEEKYRTQVERNQQLNSYIEELQKESEGIKNLSHKAAEAEKLRDYYLRENEKLKLKMKGVEEELQRMKQTEQEFQRQEMKMRESDQSMYQYESKIALLSDEINSLNSLLKSKNDELVKLEDENINRYSALKQYKNLEQDIQQKDLTIQKLKTEIESCYSKIYNYENKIQELGSNKEELMETSRVKDSAVNQLRNKTRQCEEYKAKLNRLQHELAEINELQKTCQKQQNRITVYMRDIEELKDYGKKCEDAIESMRARERELEGEIQRIRKEQRGSTRSFGSDRIVQASETSSNAPTSSNGPKVNPERLITKINKLQYTTRQLKEKYNLLLKAVAEEDEQKSRMGLSEMSISQTSSLVE